MPTAGILIMRIPLRFSGPDRCRCGGYLSDDFDERKFCRSCEGIDPRDLTPRLPWLPKPIKIPARQRPPQPREEISQ